MISFTADFAETNRIANAIVVFLDGFSADRESGELAAEIGEEINQGLARGSDMVAELLCPLGTIEEQWRSFERWWNGDCVNAGTPDAIENAFRVLHDSFCQVVAKLEQVADSLADTDSAIKAASREAEFSNYGRWKIGAASLQPALKRMRDIRDAAKVYLSDFEVEAQQRQLAVVDIIQEELDAKAKLRKIDPPVSDISTEEMLRGAQAAGSLDFWNDPIEDVYSLEDGEPL